MRRISKQTPPVGRLSYVHPICGELFYLRVLLTYQRGCCSYVNVRTIDGVVAPTIREAFEKLGVTGNDKEWNTAISEAAERGSARERRELFVYLLLYCDVSSPMKLWQQNWKCMADGINYSVRQVSTTNSNVQNDNDLQHFVLHDIENLLNSNSTPKSLADFGLPMPDASVVSVLSNSLLLKEKNYDRDALKNEHLFLYSRLHPQQLMIYDAVMNAVKTSSQVILFVYGYRGIGETYLWKTLIVALWSTGEVVLAVAASSIASLLLRAGRTAYSRFKIPLELTEESVCHIKKKTNLCQLLLETTLIIWDEAPMNDRRYFELLDKTLQDLTDNNSKPFGGKSVLLGGDFRQTLPIKPKCSKTEIIQSCLIKSYLWKQFTIFKHYENMRVTTSATTSASERLQSFAQWILKIGDGDEGFPVDPLQDYTKEIEIPAVFLLHGGGNKLEQLIDFIYGGNILQNPTPATIFKRAIICHKNETADEINSLVQSITPGMCVTYLSTNSMVPHSKSAKKVEATYPVEYLNVLNFSGVPPHCLQVKKNSPVILMRNMDPKNGLCNGTRLLVSQLMPRVIEARIITGT